jgi:hypothetical protein
VLNSLRLALRRLALRRHVTGLGLVPATATTAVAVIGQPRRLNPSVTARLF